MVIGWILLALITLPLVMCVGVFGLSRGAQGVKRGTETLAAAEASTASSALALRVIDIQCDERARMSIMKVTVENTGGEPVEYAKLFGSFVDDNGSVVASEDSYFSPHTIPVGSRASADLYSRAGGVKRCQIGSVQDRAGRPVNIIH